MRLSQECLYELSHPPGVKDLLSPTTFPSLDAVIRESPRTKAVLREIGRMVLSLILEPMHCLTIII